MRKTTQERLKEYITPEIINKNNKVYDDSLELIKNQTNKYTPQTEGGKYGNDLSKFIEINMDLERFKMLVIVVSLKEGLEENVVTKIDEIREIIKNNRPALINSLSFNWTSKKNKVFEIVKKLMDEKILVFDKSKGGIDWKGRYRFDYERIVEYFKIPELHSDIKKEFEDDNINITNYDYFLAQVDMALEILTIKDLFSDDISKKFKQ
jgi:hypothetical protein